MRAVVGFLLGLLVRVWVATWRVRVRGPEGLFDLDVPLVFAFWHGRQMALLGARRRRPAVTLVSWSKDGELQAGAMRALGFRVVRGSSSRGGAAGLRRLARALTRRARDAVFAVDGPRGPARFAKPGVARAAKLTRGLVVPVGSAVSRSIRIGRSWDEFEIPLPFARVVVVLGAPLGPGELERELRQLDVALGDVMLEARRVLGRPLWDSSPATLSAS